MTNLNIFETSIELPVECLDSQNEYKDPEIMLLSKDDC